MHVGWSTQSSFTDVLQLPFSTQHLKKEISFQDTSHMHTVKGPKMSMDENQSIDLYLHISTPTVWIAVFIFITTTFLGTPSILTCSISIWNEWTVQLLFNGSRKQQTTYLYTTVYISKDDLSNRKHRGRWSDSKVKQYLLHTSAIIISATYSTITGFMASLWGVDAFEWELRKMSACDLVAPAFIHDELCCNHIQAVATHVTSSWILQDLSDNKDKANTTSNTAQGQLTNSFHLRISQKNNMSTTIILLFREWMLD